jgi:hypothetical protein
MFDRFSGIEYDESSSPLYMVKPLTHVSASYVFLAYIRCVPEPIPARGRDDIVHSDLGRVWV